MTLGWKLGRWYVTDLFCNVDGHTTEESALTRLNHKKKQMEHTLAVFGKKSTEGIRKKVIKTFFCFLCGYQYR
jgi:hypothetical protein